MSFGIVRLIAVLQLTGVVLLLTAQVFASQQAFHFSAAYVLIVVAVGALGTYASVTTLRGRPDGLRWSTFLQFIQIINWSTSTFSYVVALGPYWRLKSFRGGWESQIGFGGTAGLDFEAPVSNSPILSLNVFAFVAFVYLVRYQSHRVSERPDASSAA